MIKIPKLTGIYWAALLLAALSLSSAARAQDYVGQWEFNGNLDAASGDPLQFFGDTQSVAAFGETTPESLNIPPINGEVAEVLMVPKTTSSQGLVLPVPAIGNGGGDLINNWSVILDVFYPAESSNKKRPILELVDETLVAGAADVEFYIGADNGLGYAGKTDGSVSAGEWHRIAFSIDFDNRVIRKFVDGINVGEQVISDEFADGRWALDSFSGVALLFRDDNDESEIGYVNSMQLRDFPISSGQAFALGGPSAAGIPAEIPPVPSFVEGWTPAGVFGARDTDLGVVINPGDTTVTLDTIVFSLDGTAIAGVTPVQDPDTGLISIEVPNPELFLPTTEHTISVAFTDDTDGAKVFEHTFRIVLLLEDFNGLTLGPNVDEGTDNENAWTPIPPDGWVVDRSGVPGADSEDTDGDGFPDMDGVSEWAGWSFADVGWWAQTAGDQQRSEFTRATGAAAIADPDEWDDAAHADSAAAGWYKTKMTTKPINVEGLEADTVFVQFDSSWRPEFDSDYRQSGRISVSYDGGEPQEVLLWLSDPNSPNFKVDATNEGVIVALNNPAGAAEMLITFEMFDAGNDWWWAIDNIIVNSGTIPPFITQQPSRAEVPEGQTATLEVGAGGGEPLSFQWYKGTGAERAAIDGATGPTLVIESVLPADAGIYTLEISNDAGLITSDEAELVVLAKPGGTTLLFEDFEGLELGPNFDETLANEMAWTKTPPEGWSINDDDVPGAGIDIDEDGRPDNDGVTEWAGWSFADKNWWAAIGGQSRDQFLAGQGTVAVADGDEWDDQPRDPGNMSTFLITREISLEDIIENTVVLKFDSSWRPDGTQIAVVEVAYDGGVPIEVIRWESNAASEFFKPDTFISETVALPLENPAGAQTMVVTFGYLDAGNNWWWAIDNIEVSGDLPPIFAEDFDGLELGPNVDEEIAGTMVWTKTPPDGWSIDDSGVAGAGTDNDGVTEWAGWGFADPAWWAQIGGQNRDQFTRASGAAAIADGDEWDDLPHADGNMTTFLTTPSISLEGVDANTALLQFDSSWRPEPNQLATITATYDGGDPVEILRWESDSGSANFHADNTNEAVLIAMNNPEGASNVVLTFGYSAGNNWWWAIDNLVVRKGTAPPVIVEHPLFADVTDRGSVSFAVTATGGPFSFQWFKDGTAIPGATLASYSIPNVTLADAGAYHVEVTNPGGTVVSRDAYLTVLYPEGNVLLLDETFDGLELGPNVDEDVAGTMVWTGTPPAGWNLDNSGVPGVGDGANDGVTEWAGWGFADPVWWNEIGGQDRDKFTKASGAAAIADGDEWDDQAHADGTMTTLLSTPALPLGAVGPDTLVLQFDSSWRPDGTQIGVVQVAFDGGDAVDLIRWESDSASPNFKPDNDLGINETISVPINNPAGASEVVITFGYLNAGNNWWWAIDNIRVTGTSPILYSEDFENVQLGPSVDEEIAGDNVWSKFGPPGWVIDDSAVPGARDYTMDGVTEWAGWSFADKDWWAAIGGQDRALFELGTGTILIGDGDEWDDLPHADGKMSTILTTPAIPIDGVAANSLVLEFDSSWRPFDAQTGLVTIQFDDGAPIEIIRWDGAKPDTFSEHVVLPIDNPDGAATATLSFGYLDAGNDWWWALDNIVLLDGNGEIFAEDFDGLPLYRNFDEGLEGENVWTHRPPAGWTRDDSGVPGVGSGNDGVTEWAGWSFADKGWWDTVAGQSRGEFTDGEGAVAIADGDEWDDQARDEGLMSTFLLTPLIDISEQDADTLSLRFASSWRPEVLQTAVVTVAYDGGEPVEVLRYDSDTASPNYKSDTLSEIVQVPLGNPAGASTMRITFGYLDAGNNWWWAIDNVEVLIGAGSVEPQIMLGIGLQLDGMIAIAWTDTEARLQSAPTVDGPWEDVAGATSPFLLTPDADQAYFRLVK